MIMLPVAPLLSRYLAVAAGLALTDGISENVWHNHASRPR
jgi:hypothetical protein